MKLDNVAKILQEKNNIEIPSQEKGLVLRKQKED